MNARATQLARYGLVAWMAVYGFLCMRSPGTFRLLDGVDLAIHETGHLVFAPFGEFIGMLGGTLLQLIFPALFVGYFLRKGERLGAAVALWWLAQNCWNVSVYIADARAQELPLVGGGEHDWAYLLGEMGRLHQDAAISRMVLFAGALLYAVAVFGALLAAMRPVAAPVEADAAG